MKIVHLLHTFIKKKWKFEFLLILCCFTIVSVYTLRLNVWGNPLALTNDNIGSGYPFRILISSAIQNRIFPLWDHWSLGGMPLNTPVFNLSFSPIILFLSLFGVYSMTSYVTEIFIVILFGFLGMYTWLRKYSSKYSALWIALCFSLLASQIIQMQLNCEVVVSTAMLPWIAVGMHEALRGMRRGIGIIALSLWIVLTNGYLGMNVIFIELLLFYTLCTAFLLLMTKKISVHQILHGIVNIGIGLTLGFLIVNYAYVEAFAHFGISFATNRLGVDFSPFIGSANLYSLSTLFFPNHVWSFSPNGSLGNTAMMFFGSFPLFLSFFSFIEKRLRTLSLLLFVFFLLSFGLILSSSYPIAYWINSLFPLLKFLRWHAWMTPASVFFLATLSAIGCDAFYDSQHTSLKTRIYFIFVFFCFTAAFFQSRFFSTPLLSYLYFPQIAFIAVLGLIIFIPLHKLSYLLLPIALSEIIIVLWSLSLYGNNYYWIGYTKEETAKREVMKDQTKYFPSQSNERLIHNYYINPQYYSKQPAVYGYHSLMNPVLSSYSFTPVYIPIMMYLFYSQNEQGYPNIARSTVGSVRLTPVGAETDITVLSDDMPIVWSTPFTPYWKLYIDGQLSPTQPNKFWLTQFHLSKGKHYIRFLYRPPYLIPSCLLTLCALGLSLYCLTRRSTENKKFNKSNNA